METLMSWIENHERPKPDAGNGIEFMVYRFLQSGIPMEDLVVALPAALESDLRYIGTKYGNVPIVYSPVVPLGLVYVCYQQERDAI